MLITDFWEFYHGKAIFHVLFIMFFERNGYYILLNTFLVNMDFLIWPIAIYYINGSHY